MRGALDRSRHQLGEEADIGCKGHRIARGGNLPTVDIDGIAERLEGIEADADRQDEPQCRNIGMTPSAGLHQPIQTFGKEAEVLEAGKNGHIERDVTSRNETPVPSALYEGPAKIAAQRGDDNQEQEAPVPPAIEHVAGKQHKQVLPAQPLRQCPVNQERDGQEEEEGQ